ncbi:hypothetical protein [Pseudolactococcus carnosus]|uniref:hypothetical protein n=1 Tax=Pseudolactococcus carnosus TaxID=2749961 RepID=UPI001FBB0FA5|nr:hypothetical protein [Lactococcus carnosus]MCJ1970977.1 hypothetical protein [Lactococcus carnosus]MCJ1980431.1 hypothetical protein [Lactococcus carnosus]MCJ2000494.1 hypothetical protein [Lactococcus carnosus]
MSEKLLLSKLKSVGNPLVLLKMMNEIRIFVKSHQIDFPKNEDKSIYIQIDDVFYQVEQNRIENHKAVSEGNYIFMSEAALLKVKKIMSLDSTVSLSEVIISLRKARNIKQYKLLLEAVNDDFKTNISMVNLVEIAIKSTKK